MSTERYDFESTGAQQDFPLLYISHSRYSGDWRSMLHTHHHAELFFLVDGKGLFQVGSQRFPVRSGSLVVVNPYVAHTELSSPEEPLEYIVVGLNGVQFDIQNNQEQRFFFLDDGGEQPSFNFYLQAILRERARMEENYLPICSNLSQAFLLQLRRRISKESMSLKRTKSNSSCIRVKQYIDEHYSENITLDKLAEMTHMSKYHLVHAFNAEVGCSPISYLQSRRIAASRRLLELGGYSVSQVSSMTGFSSASYFSQRFKKTMGVTPQEYSRDVHSYALAEE